MRLDASSDFSTLYCLQHVVGTHFYQLHNLRVVWLVVASWCSCRFDLRVVSDSSSTAKKGPIAGADLLQVPKKAMQQESRLRYRDGRVVSTKGEKIIVEKVGEEWDGGSR